MSTYDRTRSTEDRTLKDLTPNVAGLLCYVAGWISGIVFLVLEQKNRFVRFHALQSIIAFGSLALLIAIFGRIPYVGTFFNVILGITTFVLWIILMVKAVNSEYFKLPWAGDLADRLASETMGSAPGAPPSAPAAGNASTPEAQNTVNATDASASQPVIPAIPAAAPVYNRPSKAEEFRTRYYSSGQRSTRIVGSAFAIAWSAVLLIFFNFYNQYIAYYEQVGTHWERHTVITADFNNWLPLVTTALVISIIGHALVIIYDKYVLRQILGVITDVFGLAVVVTLLSIFPFDFSSIQDLTVIHGIEIGLTVTLILVAVGFGISALVKFIQLIVHTAEGKY